MSNAIKIFAALFVCVAGIFLYAVSFSLKAFLSLIALGVLIALQILFISRRVITGQYKNSEDASSSVDNSPCVESVDFDAKEPETTPVVPESRDSREELQKEPDFQDKKNPADDKVQESFKAEPISAAADVQKSKAKATEIPADTPKQPSNKSSHEVQVLQKTLEELIMKVQDCLKQKKYQEGLSLIDRFLEETSYTFHSIEQIISVLKLKGDCEFYVKNYEKASKIWLLLFNQNYLKPNHPRFFPALEDIIAKCEDRKLKQGLYFLLILLNRHRQSGNLEKTDETYYKLEEIYRADNDSEHLIKIYQSHIAVKEKLGDDAGQIQLLDYLGKLYYHQGNAEDSKKCYEQRMALEKQAGKQQAENPGLTEVE